MSPESKVDVGRLKCPTCRHEFKVPISRLDENPDVECPICQVTTRHDPEKVRELAERADGALRDRINRFGE
jgi:hypothetical protein